MRNTKISKPKSEPWSISDKINSILAVLTFFAVIGTIWSTYIANEALSLQREQTIKSEKKDSLDYIQDTMRNNKFMDLTQQQIDALKQQAWALERGVKNTEISQRPQLDIANLGFHFTKNNDLKLYYHVKNYGIKPAILDKVVLTTLDAKFNVKDSDPQKPNIVLVNDKVHQVNEPLKIDNKKYSTFSEELVLSLETFYCYFVIHYTDSFNKKKYNSLEYPIFYKWVKNTRKSEYYIITNEQDTFYPFELCSKEEEKKIMVALKMKAK